MNIVIPKLEPLFVSLHFFPQSLGWKTHHNLSNFLVGRIIKNQNSQNWRMVQYLKLIYIKYIFVLKTIHKSFSNLSVFLIRIKNIGREPTCWFFLFFACNFFHVTLTLALYYFDFFEKKITLLNELAITLKFMALGFTTLVSFCIPLLIVFANLDSGFILGMSKRWVFAHMVIPIESIFEWTIWRFCFPYFYKTKERHLVIGEVFLFLFINDLLHDFSYSWYLFTISCLPHHT